MAKKNTSPKTFRSVIYLADTPLEASDDDDLVTNLRAVLKAALAKATLLRLASLTGEVDQPSTEALENISLDLETDMRNSIAIIEVWAKNNGVMCFDR